MKEKTIHEGHRQRLKEQFLRGGLAGFNEINALELLLFYCIPKQDTNPLAHRLIDEFGSFDKVIEASPKELERVQGVGPHVSMFFSLICEAANYYQRKRAARNDIMRTADDCGEFLIPYFRDKRNETVYLLCMDAKCKVLSCEFVGEGSVNSAGVPIRRIVEMALKAGASTVVLAHNHPSGLALPSGDDVRTTKRLARALSAVEIVLTDHIVVADEDFVSLALSGYYDPAVDAEY